MPSQQPVALALGANVGHRETALRRAVLTLRDHLGPLDVASIYHGDAVDLDGQATSRNPSFLNTALVGTIPTSWQPEGVLALVKALELAAGRRPGARYAARPLDVDLLWLGEHRRTHDALQLPHPALLDRRFVLAPLAEIDPHLRWPDGDLSAGAALAALPASAPPVARRAWRRPLPS